MAKFQELVMKLIESHSIPLSAARKSIIQDRVKQLLSQSQFPDHPPYAAMIERALRELSKKLGSSEDSISKFIKKEYKNLPLAHSALLKHHLRKLCEYGEIVIRGQKYMLAGSLSSTVHKRKKTKKKKHENKQKNLHKRDQKDDISEDLENNSSEKAMHGEEKTSVEGEVEKLVSNDLRESNDSFLSTESPIVIECNENKNLKAAKFEDKNFEHLLDISSEKLDSAKGMKGGPIFLSTESPIGIEFNGNKNLKVEKLHQLEEDKVEDKNFEHLLDISSEKLDSAEGMKVGPTSKEQPTGPPITSGPLIVGPIKDISVGPKGSELVSSKELCESLLNRTPVEPKAEETTVSIQEHKLNPTDEKDLRDQSEKPKKSTPLTYQRAKLRESNDSFLSTESPIVIECNGNKNLKAAKLQQQEEDKVEDKNFEHLLDISSEKLDSAKGMKVRPSFLSTESPDGIEFNGNKNLKAAKLQQQEEDKVEDKNFEHLLDISSEKLDSAEGMKVRPSFLSIESPIGIEFNGNKNLKVAKLHQQEEDKVEDKNFEHLLDISSEKLDSAEGMKVGPTSEEQPPGPPITSGPLIFGPIKDKSVGPKGCELVSSKEFCESLLNRRPVEPKAEDTTVSIQENKLNPTDEKDLRDQSEKPKKSTPLTYQRTKLRSYKRMNEDEQLNLSKTDGKEVVIVDESNRVGAKKRGRRRKTLP